MKKELSIATALLVLLAGCQNTSSSTSSITQPESSPISSVISENSTGETSSESSTSSSSESSSSSSEEIVKTAALTDEMLSGLNGGYSAEVSRACHYEGGSSSRTIAQISVNDKNYAFKRFSTDDGITKKTQVEDSHYQIKPGEEYEMIYNAGLSIGNTIIYTPVTGRDPYTFDEIHLTWEEGYYSNVFATLSAANFTRIGEENKFALNVDDYTLLEDEVFEKLDKQLYGEAVEAEVESFYLLTNGDKITGFELKYEPYLSYDTMAYREVSGTFTGFGADVTSFMTPLTGRGQDAEFDAAIARLKEYNYSVVHSQSGYDFNSNKFVGRGRFEAECDGETLNYYYYDNNNKKRMNYAYYDAEYEGETYLQGATNINGTYYNDVLYYGSLMDMLPSFEISSEMFIKSSESTNDVLVYDLDKSVVISLDNDNATYSSFDSDGYNDRTVYLTITIDKTNNTITFHNETTKADDSGLIEDVVYSNIGGIEQLITTNVSDTCDGLTWKELLSNDEASLAALLGQIPEATLATLPTFGGQYSYVHYDSGAAALFVNTYAKADNEALMESYSQKLVDAEFTANEVEEGGTPSFYTIFQKSNRSYKLTLTLNTYWNNNLGYGQFQVFLQFSRP